MSLAFDTWYPDVENPRDGNSSLWALGENETQCPHRKSSHLWELPRRGTKSIMDRGLQEDPAGATIVSKEGVSDFLHLRNGFPTFCPDGNSKFFLGEQV